MPCFPLLFLLSLGGREALSQQNLLERVLPASVFGAPHNQIGNRVTSEFAIEWPLLQEKWWILAGGILLQVAQCFLGASRFQPTMQTPIVGS